MSASPVIELNYENFEEEVLGHDKPVLIEFYADSSYACRELDGIIDDVAQQFAGKLIVARLDIEANWQTAQMYDVKTAPTVLCLQHDRVVDRMSGSKTRAEYLQAVNELIAQHWEI